MKHFIIFLFYLSASTPLYSLTISQKSDLKKRVEKVVEKLDSQSQSLDNSDFITSMYQQLLQFTPSPMQYQTMKYLLDGYGEEGPLNRSHFVEQLIVIKEEKDFLSYEDIQSNIDELENLNLTNSPVHGIYAIKETEEEVHSKKKYLPAIAHRDQYKVYFGYLHAHSELSDGRGDAEDAYKMAKFEAGLDYFALTDHSELLHFWPWDKKYKTLKKMANKYNEDGRFAALYGFEWSHPILGHFNVVNTEKYTSAIIRPAMRMLMNWLAKKSGAFGRFNHPGRVNDKLWPYEFKKLKVYDRALANVVGIEMWNKGDSLREYLEEKGSFKEGHNFLDNANMNGWFVGAVGGQDNHDADWGLRNDYRVGVWAQGLSRQKIVDAYFARRTFATEDKNAWIDYKMDDAQMGSRLMPGQYKIEIQFGDKDLERVKKARLIKKGAVLKNYLVEQDQLVIDHIEGQIDDYFYVVAEQEDGDMMLSSPIWIVPE